MPVKGNQFKSNSFKNEYGEKTGQGASAKAPRQRFERMPTFNFQNERVLKIAGLFFLILAIYFLVAFTSYLFTWQEDYSYVIDANGGWSNLFKTMEELQQHNIPVVVQNWLGKFGALLSHQFIYEWFGVSSFIFVFIFFVIGYRLLFKVKIFAMEKALGYGLFALLFLSLTFGFFHSFLSDAPHYLEGEIGYWSNKLLVAQIGVTGVGGLLAFLGLTILIIAYNIDFKLPERKAKTVAEEDAAEEHNEEGNTILPMHNPLVSKVEDVVEHRPEQVEFTLNDRLGGQRKKEQNIVLTPSRFEKHPAEEEETLLYLLYLM